MLAMEECKADEGSAVAGKAILGMVIGGRAAQACDVCGKERARWYCAADLAYLCERCDGSVHSANAVASRHERVRLGVNGAPVKTTQKLIPSVTPTKKDCASIGSLPAAHLKLQKKPRSIRRHKPSSVLASTHSISAKHPSTNHARNNSSKFNTSFMYAANHSIMINNPRNDVDFIADSTIEFREFVAKAEPSSPVDVGEQAKVPDHTDDDPLFESLFDFRDLQDDDLFLHQVPIYKPPQNQAALPSIDSKQLSAVNEESKPADILPPCEDCKELGSPKSFCAALPTHLLELASEADLGSVSLPASRDGEANEGLSSESVEGVPIAKCEEPERCIDSSTGICDLDQLDFDSMLHGEDEDGDDEAGHTNSTCDVRLDVSSDDYMGDASDCHITRDDSGSYAEDHISCAGNGMDVDAVDDNHAAAAAQDNGYGEAYNFNTMGSESPRTWLCKVKVESPSEFDALMHVDSDDADALLREKLICKADTQSGFKLGLKLNFEDVLYAWSDRGSFWMDGHRPQQLDNGFDFLGGWLVPDIMSSTTTTEGVGQQLVPMFNKKNRRGDDTAREASVLRYREKRRTRLFCKKIRYEVRKLNAEKRPRMKGRFVKRISIAV